MSSTTPAATAPPTPHPTPLPGRVVAWAFALFLGLFPIAEVSWQLRRGERPRVLDAIGDFSHRGEEQRMAFEERLHDDSILTHTALPHYQHWMTRLFSAGNRKVALGRDRWLFLREDLEFAFGPSSFAPGRGGEAAVAAIVDFRDQLAARGVQLLIVPVCGKETGDPERLSRRTREVVAPSRSQLDAFHARLDEAGVDSVRVDDLVLELARRDPGTPRFLAQDVHWTPATMKAVAARVAEEATRLLGARSETEPFRAAPVVKTRGRGDLVRMLALADAETLFPPLELELEPVVDAESGAPAATSRDSEVLLLGDSFSKVFSDPVLELGSGAGFAEHLALALQQPIDVISLAGGATTAVRASLAQSPERLATKRLVIWEFSARFLSHSPDEWRRVPLPAADDSAGQDARLEVVAEIVEVSRIPTDFTYTFCLATYEYAIERVISGEPPTGHLWVAFPAIVDAKNTPARDFPVGARHRLVLEPLRKHHDIDTTSWVDDTHVEAPMWYPVEWRAE